MEKLDKLLSSLMQTRYEEDSIDRLNYKITTYIFIAASLTLTGKSYFGGKHMQCWSPAQFRDAWNEYVDDYCYVESTYWLPKSEDVPADPLDREARKLSYYQWVPFMLALQALMFYAPHVFWRMLNWLSGVQVRAVITMAATTTTIDPRDEKMLKTVKMVAHHLKSGLELSSKDALSANGNPLSLSTRMICACSRSYISCTYLFTKLLFILNCILQFYLLNVFLGINDDSLWGLTYLSNLFNGVHWEATGHFPRVTMCDFEVRTLGNLHRWSVQCVLILSIYNEKIFIFLWWWILVITAVTVINLFYWASIAFIPNQRSDFLRKMLNANSIDPTRDQRTFDALENLLGADGIVVLQLMAKNAGELICARVVNELWTEMRETPFDRTYDSMHTEQSDISSETNVKSTIV